MVQLCQEIVKGMYSLQCITLCMGKTEKERITVTVSDLQDLEYNCSHCVWDIKHYLKTGVVKQKT